MAMDRILRNYVCELFFWCKGFGRNHHDNVYDWINLQGKQYIRKPYSSAKMLRISFTYIHVECTT